MAIDTLELLKLEEVKARFGLVDKELPFQNDDDRAYEASLLNLVETANRHLTLDLVPILGQIDLAETGLWQDCQNTAYTYFRSLFERDLNRQMDPAKMYLDDYKDQLKTIKTALMAGMPSRPPRSKLAIFSSNPNDDQLILPNQKYDTILD